MEKKLARYHVGEIPLMEAIVKRLKLRSILDEFIPRKKNEKMAPADVLILFIYNLAIGKTPLYELEEWVSSLELRCMGYEKYRDVRSTDDRFGSILDKIYDVDRASLMTKIVIEAVKTFNIDLKQLHNDSTSVKAFGKYPGKTSTGFELKFGKSKDHRPDLKQLIFSLSISADGAIPIHYKSYPGNRNDDTTHIETWDTLCKINQGPNFLYVADCKLCTDNQLHYINEKNGKALAPIPEQWSEVVSFKESLRKQQKRKKEIWRRQLENDKIEYFFVFDGEYLTTKRGYKIHWIYSTEKREIDFVFREEQLKKAERKLLELLPKINKRNLKSLEAIQDECSKIVKQYKVEKFITICIGKNSGEHIVKATKGRPNKNTNYQKINKETYTLSWDRDRIVLEAEKNVDGIYPLLSTDKDMSAREAVIAFKYQPKLEKRFTQLKSIHDIAPLLFKKIERVEASMFLFFIALMIQALIEREIRHQMKNNQLLSLQVYPESRDAAHPTTSKVFNIFSNVSTYTISEDEEITERYTDELTPVQKTILKLLSIEEKMYWLGIKEKKIA